MYLLPYRSLLLSCFLVLLLTGCNSSNVKLANKHPLASDLNPEQVLYPAEIQTNSHLTADSNLWHSMSQSFQWGDITNQRINKEIKFYLKHPDYIETVTRRSEPYLYFIINEIKSRGLPMELALLPIIESAFNPIAHSQARAAGLWQFIPSTGRMFGLQQNWWYDGRRDVVKSTHAALDYLQQLNRSFDGDWELALAAYNMGSRNIRRAIRKNAKKNKPTDYWALDLARETEAYLPKLYALAHIIRHQDTYGLALTPVTNQPYFSSLTVDRQIDLAIVSRLADVPEDEINRLNSGYKRFATQPNKSSTIHLPIAHMDLFTQNLVDLKPHEYIKSQLYTVKKGDSLSRIAQQFSMTQTSLRHMNRLKSHRIKRGQRLRVAANRYPVAKHTNKKRHDRIVHTVKHGDTLWDLARSYRVNYKKLASWNKISTRTTLRLGQKLVIWIKKQQIAAKSSQFQINPS